MRIPFQSLSEIRKRQLQPPAKFFQGPVCLMNAGYRDKRGLRALDWTLKFSDMKVTRMLRETSLLSSEASRAAQPPLAAGDLSGVEKSVAQVQQKTADQPGPSRHPKVLYTRSVKCRGLL